MNKLLNSSIILLIIVLSQILVGCGKPKVPGDDQVRTLISSRMPSSAPWKLSSVTTEKLPTGDGLATVKFKAVIALDQDLFNDVDIARGFKSVGVDSPDWPGLVRRLALIEEPEKSDLKNNLPIIEYSSVKIIEPSGQKGEEIPFYGTMELKRMVDMWSLESFTTEKAPKVSGRPREGAGEMLLGSDEHKAWVEGEITKYKAFESKLEAAEIAIKARKEQAAALDAKKNAEMALKKEAERKQYLESYAKVCTPGVVWQGIWRSEGLSGKIAIRIIEFHNEGQVVRAEVFDPDQPEQKRELGGNLMGLSENHYGFPVRLSAARIEGATRPLKDVRKTTTGTFLNLLNRYSVALGIKGDALEGETSKSMYDIPGARLTLTRSP